MLRKSLHMRRQRLLARAYAVGAVALICNLWDPVDRHCALPNEVCRRVLTGVGRPWPSHLVTVHLYRRNILLNPYLACQSHLVTGDIGASTADEHVANAALVPRAPAPGN